jgi:hypothetical protein
LLFGFAFFGNKYLKNKTPLKLVELTFSTYKAGMSCLSTPGKQGIPHFSTTYLCLLDLSYAFFNDPKPKEM